MMNGTEQNKNYLHVNYNKNMSPPPKKKPNTHPVPKLFEKSTNFKLTKSIKKSTNIYLLHMYNGVKRSPTFTETT